MKTIALLTGRGGSTLKDKNLLDISGHPVLYYPARAVRKCPEIDDWYCSSDSKEILRAAGEEGYKPIVRPPEFALPSAQHVDCIYHALEVMKCENNVPDILVVVLANNVAICSDWVTDCVRRMKNDASITAVVPVYEDNDHHPLRAKTVDENGMLQMYEKDVQGAVSTNRQELPSCLFLAHNFWVLNVPYLLSRQEGQQPWSFMGDRILPFYIDESVDIHRSSDLLIAEQWLKTHYYD